MDSLSKSGQRGEFIAAWYLAHKKGFRVIKQHQTGRMGEVDIIAEDNGQTVFVEVKYRSSKTAGIPEDSINYAKIRRLMSVILAYVSRNSISNYRIDILAIVEDFVTKKITIRHHQAVSDT